MELFVIITQSLVANRAPIFSNNMYEITVPENLTPGSFIKSTEIRIIELEMMSFYASGFTLQLLNSDLVSPSNTFQLAFTYVKNKANIIIKLSPNADLKLGKLKYNLVVCFKFRAR